MQFIEGEGVFQILSRPDLGNSLVWLLTLDISVRHEVCPPKNCCVLYFLKLYFLVRYGHGVTLLCLLCVLGILGFVLKIWDLF